MWWMSGCESSWLLSGLFGCFVDGWEPYSYLFQEELVALVGVEATTERSWLDPGLQQEKSREQPAQ